MLRLLLSETKLQYIELLNRHPNLHVLSEFTVEVIYSCPHQVALFTAAQGEERQAAVDARLHGGRLPVGPAPRPRVGRRERLLQDVVRHTGHLLPRQLQDVLRLVVLKGYS